MVVLTFGYVLIKAVWYFTDTRSYREQFRDYFTRTSFEIGGFTLFYLILSILSALYFPFPANGFNHIGFGLGLMLYIGGLVLAIWGKLSMKKSWGLPGQHKKETQDKLIISGPFQYTRNPIYLGFIMFLLGYGFLLQSYFTFLVLIAIWYFYKSAEKEEKLLEKHFGKEYLKYKQNVPEFI